MTDDELKIAQAKFAVGDALFDVELNGLAFMFNRIQDDLRKLTHRFNAGFGLAYKEVLANFQRLESYQMARAGI